MDDPAADRIAANRATQDPRLDLSGLAIEQIPYQVAQLGWLTRLNLSNTGISDLQPLAKLGLLSNLNISKTRVASLAPLSALHNLTDLNAAGTRITDCEAMMGLLQLQRLGLWNTKLADLAPLRRLVSLQSLIIWRTQVSDLTALAGMAALEELDIDFTPVRQLDALAGLDRLETLSMAETPVADLAPVRGLQRLRRLHCNNTELTRLDPLAGLSQLRYLKADNCKLESLQPLAALVALQELSLWRVPVSDARPLADLQALQTLELGHSRVSDLSVLEALAVLRQLGLSDSAVTDIKPLAGLRKLTMLDLANTGVHDLSPLQGLPDLHRLDLSNVPVTDLATLRTLPSLSTLILKGGSQAQVNQLGGLGQLQALDLQGLGTSAASSPAADGSNTGDEPLWRRVAGRLGGWWRGARADTEPAPVAAAPRPVAGNAPARTALDISTLGQLPALKTVSLAGQPVTDLSPLRPMIEAGAEISLSAELWQGPGILVKDCPLAVPPLEVVAQGHEAVLNYFSERESGVDHLYEAKLLILGEGRAGKTSLLRRLYQPSLPLPAEQETTRGIAIHRHDFTLANGRSFRLNVWDFGGQEIYHATHQFFLTRRSLYVLLDDTRKDHKSVSDEGFKYWLDLVDVFGGRSPVLIFQNEKGGRSKEIDLAGIKGRFDNVLERYAGNLELPGAADKLRQGIAWHASHLGHIGEELPARWVALRARIEQVARERPYISRQEYFDLYAQQMPFDRKKALHLSRYLHDLGVFLHFQGDDPEGDDNVLARSVILRNTWATEAVFRILDDELVKAQRGRFTRADCQRIWHDPVYADMHPELLALMQRFELCYELADSRPATWLAPQLLPASKPAALEAWAQADDLVLRFRYDFMPKGLISRLTVRLHRLVRDADQAWVTGVLLETDQAQVLVQRLPQGGEIELRARGADRKTLLSVAAAEMDALNLSFSGLGDRVDKRIPCVCSACRRAEVPAFFGQRSLLKRREDRRWQVECQTSYEQVSVLELLDGIAPADFGPTSATKGGSGGLRVIKIFLASSSELAADRDAFDLHFRQLNDELLQDGLVLQIVRWERFLDAMSATRLQDEYNAKARACDVFVSLFFRKTGIHTEDEFNHAYGQFKASGKPRVFTYFKDAAISTGSLDEEEVISLLTFKKKLKALGHYPSHYTSAADLHLQFRDQLSRLRQL